MILHAPIAIDSVASIPWKNGGGTTRQLAVGPADATANDFAWRISIAEIGAPGEFSAFPGIDRTILLWHGEGVMLRSPAWVDHLRNGHRLDDSRVPFSFRGEDEVACDLLGGPTQDLNLMVRRGEVDATFEILHEGRYAVPVCDEFFLLCASGSAQFAESGREDVVEIGADQFLRASMVGEDQAVVLVSGDALLVGIALRVLA
jgi:environmental stress-induced protein Ves